MPETLDADHSHVAAGHANGRNVHRGAYVLKPPILFANADGLTAGSKAITYPPSTPITDHEETPASEFRERAPGEPPFCRQTVLVHMRIAHAVARAGAGMPGSLGTLAARWHWYPYSRPPTPTSTLILWRRCGTRDHPTALCSPVVVRTQHCPLVYASQLAGRNGRAARRLKRGQLPMRCGTLIRVHRRHWGSRMEALRGAEDRRTSTSQAQLRPSPSRLHRPSLRRLLQRLRPTHWQREDTNRSPGVTNANLSFELLAFARRHPPPIRFQLRPQEGKARGNWACIGSCRPPSA